jgi:hypothetical protein
MKTLLIILLCSISLSTYAGGLVHVNGYTRADGTWVEGHVRTAPNDTITDNFSYRGTGGARRWYPASDRGGDVCYGLSEYECRELAIAEMTTVSATTYRNMSLVVTNSTVELSCMPYHYTNEPEILPRDKAIIMSLHLQYGLREYLSATAVNSFIEFTMRDGTTRWSENVVFERDSSGNTIISLSNRWRATSRHHPLTPPTEDIVSVLSQATSVAAVVGNARYVYSLTGIVGDINTLLRACPNN